MIVNTLLTVLLSVSLAGPAATKKKKHRLTAAEQKVVAEARLEYAKSRHLPPPSENMQKKMQSSVGPVPVKPQK